MSEVKKKTFWPWGIVLAIFGVILMSVYTVIFALDNPVQMSNDHLGIYQDVDKNINTIINDNIAFNDKYTLSYETKSFDMNNTVIQYKIVTKEGVGVDTAVFEALLTRPDESFSDIRLKVKSVKEGLYTFETVDLNKPGRWNIFVNVSVGDLKGFKRLKLDTRYPQDASSFDIATVMN